MNSNGRNKQQQLKRNIKKKTEANAKCTREHERDGFQQWGGVGGGEKEKEKEKKPHNIGGVKFQ